MPATSKLLHFVGLPQVYSKLTNSRRPASKPPPPQTGLLRATEYLLYLLQDKDNVTCVRIYRGVAYTNIIRKLSNVMQEMKIESSQSTDVLLFKRCIDNCTQFTTDMNNMHFSFNSPHCPIPDDMKENVIFFLKSIDKLIINMRGDSKELIDLPIFYLERKPDDTFRFKSGCFAGPVHKARWMGKFNLCENKIIEQHEACSIYSDIEQTTKIEHFA